MALMSPLGGSLADRLDRRRILLVTQSAMAVVAIAMGVAWSSGRASVPVIIGLVATGGVITGINAPAWQAFVSGWCREALLALIDPQAGTRFNGWYRPSGRGLEGWCWCPRYGWRSSSTNRLVRRPWASFLSIDSPQNRPAAGDHAQAEGPHRCGR